MSGLADFERMGLWLSENHHEVVSLARCPKADGRVIAKVCEVEGLRWVWFAPFRPTKAALIEDELEELRDLPTADGLPHPEEIDRLIADVRAGGAPHMPPRAFPSSSDQRVIVNCPQCRTRLSVEYDAADGTFGVSLAPKVPPVR
jgi:hypothetical protein